MISLFVAFGTTFLILLTSRISYKNYVNQKSKNFASLDDKDFIDKIYDPYDLYSDEVETGMSEKERLKESKKHIGIVQNKKEIFKTIPVYLSIFRIFSYILLVIGFISLKDNNILEIGYYLIGVTAAIIMMVFANSLNNLDKVES